MTPSPIFGRADGEGIIIHSQFSTLHFLKCGTNGIGAAFSITRTDVDASCGAITFGIVIGTVLHAAGNAFYVLGRIVDVG